VQRYRDIIARLDPQGPPRAELVVPPSGDGIADRCLVLDASFNPPTHAHLALAKEGAKATKAHSILLQLSSANVDKSIEGADLGQRLYMLHHLAERDPLIGVTACSHARFLEKAEALTGAIADTRWIFAIGYDTLIRLFDPVYYTDMGRELDMLFDTVEFAVANRAEHDTQTVEAFLDAATVSRFRDKITIITLDERFASVSSSEIRKRVRAGDKYDHLLPDSLATLIADLHLYKD